MTEQQPQPQQQQPKEPPKTALLPKDTGAAVQDMIKTIKNLGDLYQAETRALKSTDTKAFMNLQGQKIEIAQRYESGMAQMMARKKELNMMNTDTKEKLKAVYEEFSDISRKNLEAIDRMQRCTEKLGNTIRNVAIRSAQAQRTYSYGETGAIGNTGQKKIVSSGLSETV